MPGPTIHVTEGDTLIIHAINESPYPMTLHWHGVFQLRSGWMDGASMITQCPIQPKARFTYNFTITDQSGTLFWHAHIRMFRSTVYGAFIIKPRGAYPYPKPDEEVAIVLGEWWNLNVIDVEHQAYIFGRETNVSDAFTINGKPGGLYKCSSDSETYKLTVEHGKTYLLRVINAALNSDLFFKVAGHTFTVVAVDGAYTDPYKTDVAVLDPGQTVDVLMAADAVPGNYYMAASAYAYVYPVPGKRYFNPTPATALVRYKCSGPASSTPVVMPKMPLQNDSRAATAFHFNLTGLVMPGTTSAVPLHVDHHMFMTFGEGLANCEEDQTICKLILADLPGALVAHYNNISFQLPANMSLLEAHFEGARGVYTSDFPNEPPVFFDFENLTLASEAAFATRLKATKLKKLMFNDTVEIVLQHQATIMRETHPLHLHGFDFFIVAQGYGDYDPAAAAALYNLKNPLVRNTITVPHGGWAIIRFRANNPGVWIFHCHLDLHLALGLAMAFEVQNGNTAESILPPPPPDFPKCSSELERRETKVAEAEEQ